MLNLNLETDRTIVGPLVSGDTAALWAYRSDPEVARWQGWTLPYSMEQAEGFVASVADADVGAPGSRVNLAIRHQDVLIGDVYIHVLADTPHIVEFGITLAAANQGQGFAAEVLSALLDEMFTATDDSGVRLITKAIAYVDTRNNASLALFDRLGFRREGLLRDNIRDGDTDFADEVLFGLTATER